LEVKHFRGAFTLPPRERGIIESMERRIVILSPHLDDAVLSCWHVLDGPGDVEVVNVFAGVPPAGSATGWWDRAGGSGDSARAVRARLDEDRAALAVAGRRSVNLDFLDAQYRRNGQDGDVLAAALRERLPSSTLVYVPAAFAGAGRGELFSVHRDAPHPDHAAVREAARALAAAGYEIVLYADLPHASVGTGDAWPGSAPELDGIAPEAHCLAPDAFGRKLRAVREYRSQLDLLERMFGRRLDDPLLLGHEVVWRPPAAGG
jgi:LmbE family N-acetylglucosaminyl deacetylase